MTPDRGHPSQSKGIQVFVFYVLLSHAVAAFSIARGFVDQSNRRRLPIGTITWPSCSSKKGLALSQDQLRLFELDDGKFTLGTRSAKRRWHNATHKTSVELARLAQEHRDLEKRINVLKKPGHISEQDELKRLKRRKLAVADASRAIRLHAKKAKLSVAVRNGDDSSHNKNKKLETIGSGGFCDVMMGHRIVPNNDNNKYGDFQDNTREPVAIKISRSPEDSDSLLREAGFIQRLERYPGFVRVQHIETQLPSHFPLANANDFSSGGSGTNTKNVAVVLNLLGPSLEDIWWACSCGVGGLSAATTLRIAQHMLPRLHALAQVGIAHRDIQPANILMGRAGPKIRNEPHLIDFGIASDIPAQSKETNESLMDGNFPSKSEPEHAFSGTPRFASISALRKHGGGNMAKDDLESLCYTLMFLRTGTAPGWPKEAEEGASTTRGSNHLADLKEMVEPELLCGAELRNDPAANAIGELLRHARECGCGSTAITTPDYNGVCQSIVKDALARLESTVGNKENNRRHNSKSLVSSIFTPDWDKQGVQWSSETGALQHALYSND